MTNFHSANKNILPPETFPPCIQSPLCVVEIFDTFCSYQKALNTPNCGALVHSDLKIKMPKMKITENMKGFY